MRATSSMLASENSSQKETLKLADSFQVVQGA